VQTQRAEVTRLLLHWSDGDRSALDALTPLVYEELRSMARRYFRRERPGHTLQSTALVHEAYLRLVDQASVHWQNRAHFFGVAAQIIRRILVEHARTHGRIKRGGGVYKLTLDEARVSVQATGSPDMDLLLLDAALQELAAIDERQSRLIELRYFAGLSIEEAAEALHLSPATVKRDWNFAKAWLRRRLSGRSLEGGAGPKVV
jgi:RNA polymerase sigma factor (TIGR02999 family)